MGVRLPPEYQEVDWIGSNNDAYLIIKGNVTASEAANLKVKTTVLWQYVLSRQIHGRNGRCYFGVVDGYYQNTQTNRDHTQIEAVANEWTSVEWSRNNSVCTLNVGGNIDITNSTITATDPMPFALFALGDSSMRCYCKLKETQVEIGSEQLDLIPCYRKQDSKPGMYDLVTKQFFVNQGTGEFLVGPDVIDSISPWLVARRSGLMQQGVHLPYIYKNGRFAQELGGFMIQDPPLTNYRLPGEYSLNPDIYAYLTRNNQAPLNDALVIKSSKIIDLSRYHSATVAFRMQGISDGGIYLQNGPTTLDEIFKQRFESLSNGEHVLTSELYNIGNPSNLYITARCTGPGSRTHIWIHSILLNE